MSSLRKRRSAAYIEASAGERASRDRFISDKDLSYAMKRWPRQVFKEEKRAGGQISDGLGSRKQASWKAFVREMFGRLYNVGIDKKEPAEGQEWAEELHRQLSSLPEFEKLEGKVTGDPWRAAMGAGVAAQIIAQRMPDLKPPDDDVESLRAELEVLREMMLNKDGKRRASPRLIEEQSRLQRQIKAAQGQAQTAQSRVQAGGGFDARSTLREAITAASQHLDDFDSACSSFGLGMGTLKRHELSRAISNDDRLKRIAKIAGRLRLQAQQKQLSKIAEGVGDVHGVELGSAIPRLLPSEIGSLATDVGTSLLVRRLNEQSALQYQITGRDTKTRGPILFLIDASGSMHGMRSEWAAACALAVMEIARKQRRPFAVLYFDDGITGSYYINEPAKVDTSDILEMLSVHSGGGTHIATALDHAADIVTGSCSSDVFHGDEQKARRWSEGERADVILVTDGADGSNVEPPIDRIKESGASIYTIAIECEPQEGLIQHSTEVVRMQCNENEMGAANPKLDGVFSL